MTWLHGPLLDSISIAGRRQIPLINYGRKGGERLSNWAMSKNHGWLIYVYGLYSLSHKGECTVGELSTKVKVTKRVDLCKGFFWNCSTVDASDIWKDVKWEAPESYFQRVMGSYEKLPGLWCQRWWTCLCM